MPAASIPHKPCGQPVQNAIDNRVSALYRAREITDAIAIPEDEIRAYFDDEGYGLERKVSGILVESQTEADSVLTPTERWTALRRNSCCLLHRCAFRLAKAANWGS